LVSVLFSAKIEPTPIILLREAALNSRSVSAKPPFYEFAEVKPRGSDKVSGTVMLRLGGRQAVRGCFLGSWDSPGDESLLPGGTINGSRHLFCLLPGGMINGS
jgi:hypothetical protein